VSLCTASTPLALLLRSLFFVDFSLCFWLGLRAFVTCLCVTSVFADVAVETVRGLTTLFLEFIDCADLRVFGRCFDLAAACNCSCCSVALTLASKSLCNSASHALGRGEDSLGTLAVLLFDDPIVTGSEAAWEAWCTAV